MKLTAYIHGIVRSFESIAVVALLLTMTITASDVVLGIFKKPIFGAYDLAGIGSGIAISFAIAITSWKKQHIMVDTVTKRLPSRLQSFWNVVLRLFSGAFFILISIYIFKLSANYFRTGEVCGTLAILPLWPIALLLGLSCVVQCLVSLADVLHIIRPPEVEKVSFQFSSITDPGMDPTQCFCSGSKCGNKGDCNE